jgi:hypothetical protein
LLPFGRESKPKGIASGTADIDSMKSFLEIDFFEIPAGIRCPICWDTCSKTRKFEGRRVCYSCQSQQLPKFKKGTKRPINRFIVPPKTSSPINFIITIQRYNRKTKKSDQKHFNFYEIFQQLVRKEKFIIELPLQYNLITKHAELSFAEN